MQNTLNNINTNLKTNLANVNNSVKNTVNSGVNFVKGIEQKSVSFVKGMLPPETPRTQFARQLREEPIFQIPKMDPQKEKEILDPIPKDFFDSEMEGFDPIRFWLKSLPEKKDEMFYMNEIGKYEKALSLVTSKLTFTVITNYSKMVSGMAKVHEIGLDLDSTTSSCKLGRNKLHLAQDNIVKGSFTIISKYRRRKNLLRLEYFSNKIFEIKKRETIVKALIEDGNFPEALKLLLDLNTFMAQFGQILSIREMNKKSEDFYVYIKSKVDDSIAFVLNNFDGIRYEKILIGCQLLGNVAISQKIINYYKKTIDKLLQQIALPFLVNSNSDTTLYRSSFDELCGAIQKEDLLQIVLQSLSVLSDVIYNFHQMWLWHMKFQGDKYDSTKLFVTSYKKSLWEIIQNKLSSLLTGAKFNISLESFLQIYHGMDMLCDLGEQFTQSDANGLRGALKNRSKIFFSLYHRLKMEELRMMMESEKFVKVDSNVLEEIECDLDHNTKLIENQKLIKNFLNGDIKLNLFRRSADIGKFMVGIPVLDGKKKKESLQQDDDNDDDTSSSSSSSSSCCSDDEEDKESTPVPRNNQTIYTSTSIRMMTLLERYFYAMQVLKPISGEIFYCFGTIYTFYLYNIHSVIANITKEPLWPESDPNITEQLKGSYKLLRENLNKLQREITKVDGDVYPLCKSIVSSQLTKSPSFGLTERVIALETITFVMSCIKNLCTNIHQLLPKNKEKWVPDFITEMDSTSSELKDLIMIRSISLLFSVSTLTKTVSDINWECGDMNTIQVSKYIENLLKDFKEYGKKINPSLKDATKTTIEKFWIFPIHQTMENLVEGFSRIKKCDMMGRNLMKFDLSNLEQGLKKYSPLTTIPKISYVRNYIEGYHYPPEQIWEWIQSNYQHYSKPQLESLILLGPGPKMPKTKLKDLINKLDILEREQKRNPTGLISPRQSSDMIRPSLDSQRPTITKQKGYLANVAEYFGY